ncbi:MAG: hypothetical protein CME62_08455 [Halobacteriovoraceae bacterium]|nr:hypothetical protein [Halobacteriovoraceae bacterium]|tara:strand:- start:8064 stop:8948 length:885 start_codon:yes stop_codon:yes gene_type:complete
MKFTPTLILLLITLSSFSFAKVGAYQTGNISCEMPKGEKLVIGCTNYCGRFNRWGLKWYARKLGYDVDIVNLRSNKQSIDYTQVDGILIPGGSDIDPKWYKNRVTSEMKEHIEKYEHLAELNEIGKVRDEFEFDLVTKYFLNKNQRYQPILGICRGMQVLTVSQGIPLYVDIKAELGIDNRRYKLDRVYVQNEESLIKELVGLNNFRAVELHHQGLNVEYFNQHKEKWPYLEVTSLSNKNLIAESLEFYNRPVLGVQFHPEWTFGSPRRGIFKWLLKRSCFNHVHGKKLTKGNE